MSQGTQADRPNLTMSVGRDYSTYEGEDIICRAGCFKSAATARRAGLKAGLALEAACGQ